MVHCDPGTWPSAWTLREPPRGSPWVTTIGVHPKKAHQLDDSSFGKMEQLVGLPGVRAIEVGLDKGHGTHLFGGNEQDGRVQNPRLLKNRKSTSRGLKAADVLHLIRTPGMTLPVNSPCCTYCLKKLRNDFCGNSCSICAFDRRLVEPQGLQTIRVPSTISASNFADEVVLYNEQESSAPKKQKLNCSNYPSNSIQRNATSEDMDTLDEEICLPSRSTDLESETTCISESSQDLSQNSSGSYTHTFRIDTLNHYLEAINLPTFSSGERKPWDRYVKSAKSGYCKRFLEVFQTVVSSIFPHSGEEVLNAIISKPETDSLSNTKRYTPDGSFVPLLEAYRSAVTCRHRCQILSFLTQTMSFKEINQKLPDVTYSKFFTAKNHAKLVGPGLPITPSITRHKMDPIKLDNFLDFITSEHIVRDLPYGERKVRMSNGSVIEMPNVVHSMGASDVIHQYKLFCAENDISPLGDSTMYRIIAQCGAKVRTSLEGIDYFVAEGSPAFSTLSNILEELVQIEVLNLQQSKDATSLLLQCRQYLKTDFKVHLSECCEVKDHCLIYALSDPLRPEFSKRCQHNHTYVCVPCEQLKESTSSLLKTVQCAVQENAERTEKLNDLNFKGTQAIQSITNLKNHLVRCKNQDSAKSVLFDTMRTGATLKSAIRRYINQGNDVLNASSMKKGIETMMKSVKYRVSVVEFTSKKEHVKGIPAIGSYSNFSFEEGGIRVWKAHGIGEGLLIKNDQIPAINIRYITVLEEPDDITFHQLPKRNTK
ncbi:unnamed protein product [Mytilus coruscus]|uniref:Uncharacterized protein n=1 Tax=Mytilus coruscus TaxID=42192 RepID=A0A6J8C4W1_MYTCO|nr:unnamed protein product [Mytilus coruscus]